MTKMIPEEDLANYEMPRDIYENGVFAVKRAFDEGWRCGHLVGFLNGQKSLVHYNNLLDLLDAARRFISDGESAESAVAIRNAVAAYNDTLQWTTNAPVTDEPNDRDPIPAT